jgi:hypothetical protein
MVPFFSYFAQNILMQPSLILNSTVLSCGIPYLLTYTTMSKVLIMQSQTISSKTNPIYEKHYILIQGFSKVSLHNNCFTIKQTLLYQHSFFIFVCCYNATCFDPLLGHPQAYAIQALVMYIYTRASLGSSDSTAAAKQQTTIITTGNCIYIYITSY